jgi:hypothetical protein
LIEGEKEEIEIEKNLGDKYMIKKYQNKVKDRFYLNDASTKINFDDEGGSMLRSFNQKLEAKS